MTFSPDNLEQEALILDTETTDIVDREVIELCWRGLGSLGDSGGAGVTKRFRPNGHIRWGAMAAHHILPEELIGCPPSAKAAGSLPPAKYWIGHNVDFDWEALGSPANVKRICTLALSRSLWPESDSHTLSAMTYLTQGATEATRLKLRNAHSAYADVGLCYDLFRAILEELEATTFEELWAVSQEARIPKVMTFGKHKGKPISEVDRGYVSWYKRQPDPDPYLLQAFKRAGK